MFFCNAQRCIATGVLGLIAYTICISVLYFGSNREENECLSNSTVEELKKSHDNQILKMQAEFNNKVNVTGSCITAWVIYGCTIAAITVLYICVHLRSQFFNIRLCCCSLSTSTSTPTTSTSSPTTSTTPTLAHLITSDAPAPPLVPN